MMNRGVLNRQMFANGGQAVPNEYKGFSQLPEAVQMKMDPVAAKKYQEGGPVAPAMEQGVGAMMPAPQEQNLDPQMLEQMLASAGEGIQDLESVDNFEQMMNSIRGDDASVEERRAELAGIVGEEDAAQTPESVLALAQPAIMMASVDQGIGGLAQEQMSQEVSGPMAQGIMSTVQPPAEGPPPVNFNQGGLVRRGDNQPVVMMQAGGDPFAAVPGRLGELARERMVARQNLMGDPAARLQEQKDLTQAQMLFDVANTALAFAGPMQGEPRGLSTAERLARAAQQTQLLPTIGARAAQLGEKKSQIAKEKQALQLAALGSAETALAAEAKAAEDLKLQELRGAQETAKLKLENKLDTALQTSLKQMGITAESSLEDQKQANRVALENVEQGNRAAIEQLKATGRQSDLVLANELEQENIILRGNIKLDQMGVANEYDLAKMDKAHEQATELNTTNNALKEKLAALDRELTAKRDAVAEAQGNEKLRLQKELQLFDEFYKTEKLDLERAAARLTRLGSNTNARITTLISNPESLAKYAAGTMSPEETLEFNQAIAYYNAPKSVWSEEKKDYVIVPGNPLSNELMSSIQIRQESGLTIPNIKLDGTKTEDKPETKEEIVSSIMSGIKDPSAAFGTEGSLKSVANTVAEIFFFGAPFKPEKEAIAGAQALNTKFVQVFQRSAELRDSVMQLNLLKDLTPTPASMFTGPQAAGAKITRLLGMIDEAEDALNTKLNDPDSPLTAKQVTEARGYLTDLAQLRAGYNVFDNAYKRSSNSGSKVDALRKTLGLGG